MISYLSNCGRIVELSSVYSSSWDTRSEEQRFGTWSLPLCGSLRYASLIHDNSLYIGVYSRLYVDRCVKISLFLVLRLWGWRATQNLCANSLRHHSRCFFLLCAAYPTLPTI